VPFPYLLRAHVKLYYGLSLQSGGYTQLLADGVNYTWTSATQVQLSAAPVVGQTLSIRRETPTTSRLVDWNNGSAPTADELDTADLQNFYAIQEHKDYIEALGINPNTNVTDGSITANKLSSDAVTTIKIQDAAVTSSKIQDGAVTGSKIQDGAVTSSKIQDGAITSSKIQDSAVTGSKIQDGAVTSSKIQDGAIVNADVNASAGIVATKLAFTQAGTGGTARTVDSKLRDVVSVKDPEFGAVGDGVVDDTAAILLAFQNGGHVVFPTGTYKVTTVLCQNIDGLTVDARSATFTSVYGNVFAFKGCSDFAWFGGKINAGEGANPAYTVNVPEKFPINFTVFDANNIILSEMTVVNTISNSMPCITAWNVTKTQVNNNQVFNGGDNSIWLYGCSSVTVSNNLVLNQERGRGICFQQVNKGTITGNVCADGKGDGCNVHGSSNIAVVGNSVTNMAVDTVVLGTASGISVEWDENATPTTVAAAVANPQLYNGVFSRNITVSGNTISNVSVGMRIGNNIGTAGTNYGNQGQVVIDGNNIFGVSSGIQTGTSRQLRISNNMVSTSAQACIELKMNTDTGGYSAKDIYISNNRFTVFNTSDTGYNAVQFTSGLPTASDRIILTNNEWDQATGSAGFTNVTGAALAVMEGNTSYANGVATSTTKSALMVQRQFSDQAGASTLSPYYVNRAANEFTQSGQVFDSFVTVLSIPANASIAAQIQIGTNDRTMCVGTIYAHNGNPPALTFTGIGATYVQLSGENLQIKGNTAGGTAAYGGLYSIRYSLLSPL
jgi:hypothetical protein